MLWFPHLVGLKCRLTIDEYGEPLPIILGLSRGGKIGYGVGLGDGGGGRLPLWL